MGEELTIAGAGSHITITILDYERPKGREFGPEWLSCAVDCSVGSFNAKLAIPLATEDLQRFRDSLGQVVERLVGNAAMDTIEGRIGIVVEMSSRGTATVSGNVSYRSGPDATLSFKFETDQSYLARTLRELNRVLEIFPDRAPSLSGHQPSSG